jgi:hypothetical protein
VKLSSLGKYASLVTVDERRNVESGIRIPPVASVCIRSHIHVSLFSAVLFSIRAEHDLFQLVNSHKTEILMGMKLTLCFENHFIRDSKINYGPLVEN